jgi:glycosyltransferase involved in cell wall biosynthesis
VSPALNGDGKMTLLSWIRFVPPRVKEWVGPVDFDCSKVSVVIPVRDNQTGIDRFFEAFFESHDPATFPREFIIVDNGSVVPVSLHPRFEQHRVPIHVLRCSRPGPACARNDGASVATGEWLLFCDSDCIPTHSFLRGYGSHINGALAYAGYVQAIHADPLSRYYESQEILVPPKVAEERPQYLITANALVWKKAFEEVGGFDERFEFAGGEDVDLGFRLSSIGSLSYAPASVVRHDFSDGFGGFLRRFVRYGAGNRRLAEEYGIDLRPRPFVPNVRSAFNCMAAGLQFFALSWGYHAPRLRGAREPAARGRRGPDPVADVLGTES